MDFNWLFIIPMLALLVIGHEFGHFLTARLLGVRVEEFGIGFPPRLFSRVRNGIVYSINALPIGGFVKLLGENGESGDPDSFGAQRPWKRAVILAAGSLMNLLLAVVIFTIMAMVGQPAAFGSVAVQTVVPNAPAAQAGLQSGDVLVQINGQPIDSLDKLREITDLNRGRPIEVVVLRNGEQLPPMTLTPRASPPPNQGAMGVAVQLQDVHISEVRYPWYSAVGVGVGQAWGVIATTVDGLSRMIHQQVPAELMGPIGMAQATGEVVKRGGFPWLANWTAIISLSLFMLNLLPLPALDGGRLVFVILEKIRGGRKVPPEREGYVHFVGMVVLLMLMVIISYSDILRLATGGTLLP